MGNIKFEPLNMIDGVNVGWTVFGRALITCCIAVNNCGYDFDGSFYGSADNTDLNLVLIVCTYLSSFCSCW